MINIKTINLNHEFRDNPLLDIGKRLTHNLLPVDYDAKNLLSKFVNNSAFDAVKIKPQTRFENGFANENDIPFMQETQKLIKNGVINQNSFVISDTGHDIPVFAEILKHLHMPGGFNCPNLDAPNNRRIISQAQTWGKDIHYAQSRPLQPSGLFIGLETHRTNSIDTETLPTINELKQRNIKNCVYLREFDPDLVLTTDNVKADLKNYIEDLGKASINVICKGLDVRRKYM